MSKDSLRGSIRLPNAWKSQVRSAIVRVISLAKFSVTQAYGRAAVATSPRRRQQAENTRLKQEVLRQREEIRIKDVRMAQLTPQRRPHYPPVERMAILEMRAVCGWSLDQTAGTFPVTPSTISHWMRRLDEQGPAALVQTPEPVNKFREFVQSPCAEPILN